MFTFSRVSILLTKKKNWGKRHQKIEKKKEEKKIMAYKGFKEDRETPSLNMIGCFRYPLINIYIFIRFQIVLYNDILLKTFLFLFSTPNFNKIYDITKYYILFI